jgi:hypothetical protein
MVVLAGINKLLYNVMLPYSMRDLHMNKVHIVHVSYIGSFNKNGQQDSENNDEL